MTPGDNKTKNLDQFQMTQILLILYTKFHLFSMKNEKDIVFDISPFEEKANKHIYSLFSYGTINPPYNNLELKKMIPI